MDFRRRVDGGTLAAGLLLLGGIPAGIVALRDEPGDGSRWVLALLLGALAIPGGWLIWRATRSPPRYHLGPDGLIVRTRSVDHVIDWRCFDAIILADRQFTSLNGRLPRGTSTQLLLVPAAGMQLPARPLGLSTVDEKTAYRFGDPTSPPSGASTAGERRLAGSRPPLVLFTLDEVDCDPEQLVQVLTRHAGDRFHNLSRVGRPPDGIALEPFPTGTDRQKTLRWLNRRKTALFTGWCMLLLAPALLVVYHTARVNDLLGLVTLLAAAAGIVSATIKIGGGFGIKGLVEQAVRIRGTQMVTTVGSAEHAHGLHDGRVSVLPPGGYWAPCGKAWTLAHDDYKGRPYPTLLLGDPRTGRLRSRADLRLLIDVLAASRHNRDRAAAQTLQTLGPRHPEPVTVTSHATDTTPSWSPPLWPAVTAFGRTIPLLAVVAAIYLTGDRLPRTITGIGLNLIGAALFGLYLWYVYYRAMALVAASWRAVMRPRRR